MDLGLSGAPAIITGGSAGLGLAVGRHLVAEGAHVGLIARDSGRLIRAGESIRAEVPGAVVTTATADVTDGPALSAAVDAIAERLGGLQLVVANAGGAVGGDLLTSSSEDFAATLALNAGHAADLIRAAHPYLQSTADSSVVIVSSITGVRPGPPSAYATAKAAEIHLAATLALELAADGIRVNAVSPGSFITDETTGWGLFRTEQPETYARFVADDLPLGRLGRVDEVADVVTFLLSRRSSWITGANVPVDGGQVRPTARRFPHRHPATGDGV